jgi:hypothetical protein
VTTRRVRTNSRAAANATASFTLLVNWTANGAPGAAARIRRPAATSGGIGTSRTTRSPRIGTSTRFARRARPIRLAFRRASRSCRPVTSSPIPSITETRKTYVRNRASGLSSIMDRLRY